MSSVTQREALAALRRAYARFRRACPDMAARGSHVPFSARAVPGWIYIPVDDAVRPDPMTASSGSDPQVRPDSDPEPVDLCWPTESEPENPHDPVRGDGEDALLHSFDIIRHYLLDRDAAGGAPYVPDGAPYLAEKFVKEGERVIEGVHINDGKMFFDATEPSPGFLTRWLNKHLDLFAAADVRGIVGELVEAAALLGDTPLKVSEFVDAIIAKPTPRDLAVHWAWRLEWMARERGLSIVRLLEAASVGDDLRNRRPRHEGDDRDDDSLSLRPGDCFAYDGCAYVDGDVMYFEVLEVIPRFPDDIDHVGAATGGCRVAVYCSEDASCEDHYGSDWIAERCVRLSVADMERARSAGWPTTYKDFREVLGDELALLDSRGVPVAPRGGAS